MEVLYGEVRLNIETQVTNIETIAKTVWLGSTVGHVARTGFEFKISNLFTRL